MQRRFEAKKRSILEQLDAPAEDYHDLSPKGSIDEPIRSLIHDINGIDGLVTTSSCSGRVSVFLEGRKRDVGGLELHSEIEDARAGPGGKGGGSWLYISHSPVQPPHGASAPTYMSMFGLEKTDTPCENIPHVDSRYIHIKFEPMILHILTASLSDSQQVLNAALAAGFRESGAVGLSSSKGGDSNPMVAVRSTGYSFDAIIGYQSSTGEQVALVDERYLRTLVDIANERFKINSNRIERFRCFLLDQYKPSSPMQNGGKADWEDADARRQRKRKEGLERQRALQTQNHVASETNRAESMDGSHLGGMFD